MLDSVVVKNRSAVGVEKRCVLVAMAISGEGKKHILSFKQVESESETCRCSFLESLHKRDFEGKILKLTLRNCWSSFTCPNAFKRVCGPPTR